MISKQEHADLTSLNTLKLPAKAAWLVKTSGQEALLEALDFAASLQLPVFPLGGGSNLILAKDLQAVVVHQLPEPLNWSASAGLDVSLRVPAGYNWHQLVLETTSRGLYGLENLALIPGQAGAAPVQNIGAYGAELSDCLDAVEGYWLQPDEKPRSDLLPAKDLQLGYRASRFKGDWKGRFIITALHLRLKKQAEPRLGYADLAERVAGKRELRKEVEAACVPLPRIIAETVAEIRQEKLPDPKQLPNVGSFFKNPVISAEQADALLNAWPAMPTYPAGDQVKVAAAWLIDQCGFKGQRLGAFGVHDRQALVLVHHGGGTADGLLQLAEQIQQAVKERFGIQLEAEPEWLAE
ncbi:UDP-N-acetylmuramate dehydrogenase [Marinospirillum celere]|uniref:UDP-N-acetylenolpyruvoylglucosamine reductase n=1 Tax=Marinospirillum celere TaxID=1122252 RepID=A0A1I1G7X3_9GAMM|nr:UDP-N-acetylmuramate dehydrogenase [Marinospirillum celere]SFC07456.1 UDP-N-acetylmuramate dehydrogenase [Marinospirillum celere]